MTTWILDKAHSEIEFQVKHMMISNVKGHFQDFDVIVEGSTEDLSHAKVDVKIKTGSINTKSPSRDEHLKSNDFFDVNTFEDIRFKSAEVEKVTDKEFKLVGDLTIKDATNPVTFTADFGGTAKDPWDNRKAGFTVKGSISRKDFGLIWNTALETGGVMVSDEVKFYADVQFILS